MDLKWIVCSCLVMCLVVQVTESLSLVRRTKTLQVANSNLTVGSTNNRTKSRTERFLSLFTIVRFANTLCSSQMPNMTGTCYTMAECVQRSGSASGTCAAGFGVCCLEFKTCGGVITGNSSFFVNPGGLNSYYTKNGDCSITINKCSSNICQLRLDFKTFTLAQPEPVQQVCTQDTFTVSGAANPVPVICGDNTGQHMYLDMEAGTKSWNIVISTSSGTSTTPFSRQWAIVVYQLPCDHTYDAPQDCLQYYTGATGTITSYNFKFVPVPVGGATVPGRQLSNQDYSICIRTESGFCSITYSACPDPVNGGTRGSFLINLNAQTQVNVALSGDNNCQNDYLLIPGGIVPFASVNINNYINNVFCGTALGFIQSGAVPVTTTKRPFILHFTTDSFESTRVPGTLPAEAANMGFCLNYQQHPCGTNVQP